MRTIAEKLFEKIASDAIEYGYQEEARKMEKEAAIKVAPASPPAPVPSPGAAWAKWLRWGK